MARALPSDTEQTQANAARASLLAYIECMPRVVSYHRPSSLPDALKLLRRAGVDTRVLAGGTMVNAGYQDGDASPIEVVDLQALDLAGIDELSDAPRRSLRVGSMTTLGALAGSVLVPTFLRDLARSECPSTLRNMATIGGTIAGASRESAMLAGLLACRATVVIAHIDTTRTISLASLLDSPPLLRASIVTEVSIEVPDSGTWEAVRRTPADTPIVAVAGARYGTEVSLAVSGAHRPFAFNGSVPTSLPGDFRGSGEYREEMIRTLLTRVSALLSQETPTPNGSNQ